ncbi:MAG: aliphatic sulfonate ABC transporter substrate-binding protein [Opitutia bacterium]|nr:ABC transporter substrate-binding protein [Opitutales bacterium]PHX79832.1 MAG: aliphatic sulfonate ABC transporter substrate-binding protein [Opitutae bacterium]
MRSLIFALLVAPFLVAAEQPVVLRVGFFPNLTHAPALAARQWEREGKDFHQANLPAGVKLEWRSFNAGPSAMEALIAGAIDVTYVGASPVINAHVRTKGRAIRVLAPVATGGNALVVRQGSVLRTPADFRGRRIATPQLGNTQDVEARVWLRSGGLNVTIAGGDAQVLPAQNAELIALFKRGDVDAAWAVEPWVTRLVNDFGGEILIEHRASVTTVLAASQKALEAKGMVVKAFVRSHYLLRDRLTAEPALLERLSREALGAESRSAAPKAELIAPALRRIYWDQPEDPAQRLRRLTDAFAQAQADARACGLLAGEAPVSPLLEALVDDLPPVRK